MNIYDTIFTGFYVLWIGLATVTLLYPVPRLLFPEANRNKH
jgi:hypothetical protein